MRDPKAGRNRFILPALAMIGVFLLSGGCGEKSSLERARDLAGRSRSAYQSAVSLYRELLKKERHPDPLRLELGKLYYEQGDFSGAAAELKNLKDPRARKILGLAYYRSGDFVDALEVFNHLPDPDDESLYYQGLISERLNLFDKAMGSYRKIKTPAFAELAAGRLGIIEKATRQLKIDRLDPAIAGMIASAGEAKDYPQASAQYLLCDEKIEITPDLKQVSSLHYLVRILNERGKENFSETQVEYDSTYEKVELEYARTIKPDGEVVDVGSRHIRDVSKYLNFPLYSNARVYIISFPEITEGASIEYKVKIYRNQLVNQKDFAWGYPLQSSEPILLARFSLELPKEKELYFKTLNAEYNTFGAALKPAVEETPEKKTYRWEFKDVPQIVPEANIPPEAEINPILLFSTFPSWDEVYRWWWSLAKDKIKADAAIKRKTAELVAGLTEEEARARKVYNFCAQQIRYVAVEYGQAGFEPHPAADIFRNKYGDCKDQAILLVTMLKEAGLSAFPVLIGTRDYYNLAPDFPCMLFNHCIAAVSLADKTVFLDPTAQTCSFGDLPAADQGRQVLSCTESGHKIQSIPLFSAGHNLAKQILEIAVDRDESISGKKSITSFGIYDQAQRYWLLYTMPEIVREQLENKIQEISIGGRLLDYQVDHLEDLDQPVGLEYKFQGPEFFTAAGRLRILPQLASIDTAAVAKDQRRYPIDLKVLDNRITQINLQLPADFVVKYMPEDISEDSPWLKFSCHYQRQGSNLVFHQESELKQDRISDKEYAKYKDFLENLAKKLKQRIVLERMK